VEQVKPTFNLVDCNKSSFGVSFICSSYCLNVIVNNAGGIVVFKSLSFKTFTREHRRLAKKEHKKQEQMLKEKRELAKKKEAEINLIGAEKQKKIQVRFSKSFYEQ
jgi:hypothetical protein